MRFGLLCFLTLTSASAQPYDLLLVNGRIFDGAGGAWYRGSIGIRGDAIAAVGVVADSRAKIIVDLAGLAVAPGFVDTHSHARGGIFQVPDAENCIRQGVTTLIEGPDGSSPIPLGPFWEKLAAKRISVNFGMMAGHGSIRSAVMGSENRKATGDEIQKMKAITRQAMLDGAFGLSTGLYYVPGNYAPTEEVIELARVAGALGGIHTSHMRDEAAGILTSVRETIRIGEEGGLPTQLTHHKIIGGPNWGQSRETLRLVDEARARGVDVTIDQYPYTASSTGLAALLPQWSLAGGQKSLLERLAAPDQYHRIREVVVERIRTDRGAGNPKNIQIASCSFDLSLAGKTLADVTAARGVPVTIENAADTALDLLKKGSCSAIYHAMNEQDLERILRHPMTMIASDGGLPVLGEAVPHPRNFGAFARVIARYVRERKVLGLEEAVRKMTSLPAGRFRIMDRGLIRPGMKADLAVFDPERVLDRAEFGRPHQYAEGMVHVLVNGQFVLQDGEMTGTRPGRVLYGPARR